MKEKGILFSAPMVRAILDGRKTQTRRLVREQDLCVDDGEAFFPPYLTGEPEPCNVPCPYGPVGRRLWVRETWRVDTGNEGTSCVMYRADANPSTDGYKWNPSLLMPRWASRITLEVVSVRVERLQDITEEDAKAEGVEPYESSGSYAVLCKDGRFYNCYAEPEADDEDVHAWVKTPVEVLFTAKQQFARLWDDINGKRAPWSSNPWVWRIEFRRVTP